MKKHLLLYSSNSMLHVQLLQAAGQTVVIRTSECGSQASLHLPLGYTEGTTKNHSNSERSCKALLCSCLIIILTYLKHCTKKTLSFSYMLQHSSL